MAKKLTKEEIKLIIKKLAKEDVKLYFDFGAELERIQDRKLHYIIKADDKTEEEAMIKWLAKFIKKVGWGIKK